MPGPKSRNSENCRGSASQAINLKSVRGRIDYSIFNYCAGCGTKLPKETTRCPDCRQKVRTRPWHRPAEVDLKRV